jgi:fatty-acyl-CoA synthase
MNAATDVTPGDVQACAERMQARLLAQGVGAGSSVGWLALNGLDTLGLLRACERIGARLVPLNWRLAPAELAAIAGHAGLQHLLHDEAMAGLAAQARAQLPAPLPLPLAPGHAPGDLMLVYTSGTTGTPKGALHTAAAMAANASAAIEAQGFDAGTRALAVLPMFHVGGLCIQVLPALAAGGCVRLHPRFDPGAWLRDVQAWRHHRACSCLPRCARCWSTPDWPRTDLSSLRFIATGSSVVPPALIEAFHARGVPVAQVYELHRDRAGVHRAAARGGARPRGQGGPAGCRRAHPPAPRGWARGRARRGRRGAGPGART